MAENSSFSSFGFCYISFTNYNLVHFVHNVFNKTVLIIFAVNNCLAFLKNLLIPYPSFRLINAHG